MMTHDGGTAAEAASERMMNARPGPETDPAALERVATAIARARGWPPADVEDARMAGTLPLPEARAALRALRTFDLGLSQAQTQTILDALELLRHAEAQAVAQDVDATQGSRTPRLEVALNAARRLDALVARVEALDAEARTQAGEEAEVVDVGRVPAQVPSAPV